MAHMERARAFIFAAEEDFGIVMVEAQACGTPVIAYGKGGAPEVIRDLGQTRPTGVLFAEQSIESLVAAIERFEAAPDRIDAADCRRNAERFGQARFRAELAQAIAEQLAERPAARLGEGQSRRGERTPRCCLRRRADGGRLAGRPRCWQACSTGRRDGRASARRSPPPW